MERSLALSPDEDDVSFHDPHFSSSLDPMIDAAALLDVPSLLLASGERWVSSIAWDPTAPGVLVALLVAAIRTGPTNDNRVHDPFAAPCISA